MLLDQRHGPLDLPECSFAENPLAMILDRLAGATRGHCEESTRKDRLQRLRYRRWKAFAMMPPRMKTGFASGFLDTSPGTPIVIIASDPQDREAMIPPRMMASYARATREGLPGTAIVIIALHR